MFDIYQRIEAINVDGKTFDNICATWVSHLFSNLFIIFFPFSVPIADIFQTKKRRKRQVRESLKTQKSLSIFFSYFRLMSKM